VLSSSSSVPLKPIGAPNSKNSQIIVSLTDMFIKKEIIFDINISDQKIKDQKIQEIGLIAQEKLNDKEFSTVIDVHNRVQNAGYPNYLCCRLETDNFQNILDEKNLYYLLSNK
jgi:hypothetical protein